jgi:transcriptional regulator with XRE-family HTH domain
VESWEFGQAVRPWRDRVAPETVGAPVGDRRRAAGLRREELAGLASISVDYLTRLEQGRATSPSAQVVEALARALRLSDAERELLFRLARLAAPGRDLVSTRITPSVQRLLDRLAHTPVAVYDAAWNLIVANQPYDALMGVTTSWRGIERNAVWRNLIGPGNRTVHTPEEQARFLSLLVADLRMTAARYPADRELKRLIAELTSLSPRFVELWESGEAGSPPDQSRHKVIDHPDVGLVALDCDTFIVAGDDLRIMVYTAEPGTEDAERLALAVVLGSQALVD